MTTREGFCYGCEERKPLIRQWCQECADKIGGYDNIH